MILKTYPIKITQDYSTRHKAIDCTGINNGKLVCDYITAHSDGTVTKVVNNYASTDKTGSSYGNYVVIQHSPEYLTLYAHMKMGSVTVKVGDNVKAGDVIGYMGNTGHSIGAHLHFEVIRQGIKVNPIDYMEKNLSETKWGWEIGHNYKLQAYMNVRTAPSLDAPIVQYERLTEDAKKHCSGKRAVLKPNTVVTCLSLIDNEYDGSIWMRIPSGFVCAYLRGEVYIR